LTDVRALSESDLSGVGADIKTKNHSELLICFTFSDRQSPQTVRVFSFINPIDSLLSLALIQKEHDFINSQDEFILNPSPRFNTASACIQEACLFIKTASRSIETVAPFITPQEVRMNLCRS
jgi:hypothetical protein